MASPTTFQARWTELYANTLPSLARARDPAQPKWPVTLAHCFARIILDNTVGEGQEQWDKRLKKPAVENMSDEQLLMAIELAEKIRTGDVDLVALDMQSLEARGKGGQEYAKPLVPNHSQKARSKIVGASARQKRKHSDDDDDSSTPSTITAQQKPQKHQSTLPFATVSRASRLPSPPASTPATLSLDLKPILHKISTHPTLTPYRKRLYSTLCSVPRGRYTTYAAMSSFLDSSARAVGNGMRNNPFAPEVPCHRVLAADGSIGGFCGSWGKDGEHASKKIKLLRDEGVRFDTKGKAIGQPFRKFIDLSREYPP
jgi:O-6-methylguanine DNA methyltransferase